LFVESVYICNTSILRSHWFGCMYALYDANIIHRTLPLSGLDRIHGW